MLIKTHPILSGLSWKLQVMFFISLLATLSVQFIGLKLYLTDKLFLSQLPGTQTSRHYLLRSRCKRLTLKKKKKKTHLKFKILTILNEITSTSGVRSLDSNSHFHLSRGNTVSRAAHVLVQALCSALTSAIRQVQWAQRMRSYVHFP